MTYLLWSRQSDNNQCKLVLDLAGHRDQRSACDSLVPASGLQAIDEIGVVAGIRRFIANQINSFPLPWGSAAAGFAYSVDPQTGLPRFQTYSFGPFFAERPLTSGRGAWNVQVTAQRTDWRSIDDVPLRRIAFESYRAPTDRCTADACLSQRFVSELNLTTTSTVIAASVGAADRVDIGVSVPILSTAVRGRAYQSGQFTSNTDVGIIEHGPLVAEGRSQGVGDISFRGKVALGPAGRAQKKLQAALSGELRLPFGDTDALLGTGHPAATVAFVLACAKDRLSESRLARTEVHANVLFTAGGDGISITNRRNLSELFPGQSDVGQNQMTADFDVGQSSEFGIRTGFDTALTQRITLTADYVQRTLFQSAVFEPIEFTGEQNARRVQPFLTPNGHRTSGLLAAGGKVFIHRGFVLTGSVLVGLNSIGAKPSLTPVIGLERQFLRR